MIEEENDMLKILFLHLSLMISVNLQARSPAVEPGIHLDPIATHPSQAKHMATPLEVSSLGYDFNQSSEASLTSNNSSKNGWTMWAAWSLIIGLPLLALIMTWPSKQLRSTSLNLITSEKQKSKHSENHKSDEDSYKKAS